ncbi:MAG: hypothetical protein LC623_06980 [Halobacteriales archaeon]|nr:hypothetical protein [Halobacteriales archaeon]
MKRTASFAIDTQTLERFRQAVLQRHGKLHGPFSEEAAVALDARSAVLLAEAARHG